MLHGGDQAEMSSTANPTADLRVNYIYKAGALFPEEVNEPLPLKSITRPLTQSPSKGDILHVSEDTSAWFGSRIAKGRACYLARYDARSQVGIIFLGTKSAPPQPLQFLEVKTVVQTVAGDGTVTFREPPKAFSDQFFLNFTHPLCVRVVYDKIQKTMNFFKRVPGSSDRYNSAEPLLKPPVPLAVRLCLASEDAFWQAHLGYHKDRPAGNGSGVGPVKRIEYPSDDAPWGKLGGLRFGYELPLIVMSIEDNSDEEEEEEEEEVQGVFHISDYTEEDELFAEDSEDEGMERLSRCVEEC